MTKDAEQLDAIVVGQGLAGTAIAWQFWFSGRRAFVVDREESVTSSRIAAGLVTPISGQKLVKTWSLDSTWPEADSYYRRLETLLGERFWSTPRTVRVIETESQWQMFCKRRDAGEYTGWIEEEVPLLPSGVEPGVARFAMRNAGRLDTVTYLEASRRFFERQGLYARMDVDCCNAVEKRDPLISLHGIPVLARCLVFCQGWEREPNPYFPELKYKPAKGEILTVRIAGYEEPTVLHRGMWLAPLGGEYYRCGSTYEWKDLSTEPTATAREEILFQVERFLNRKVEVIEHQAAVRPIHFQQYPVIGQQSHDPRFAYFNGLGSKGSLYAPHYARKLCESLEERVLAST